MFRKKLVALESYCAANKLQINAGKTIIVCFYKGRNKTDNTNYLCAGQTIEVVNNYEYLGVLFSSSSLFRNHADLVKSKPNIVNATELWALHYFDLTETSQIFFFFKSILLPLEYS